MGKCMWRNDKDVILVVSKHNVSADFIPLPANYDIKFTRW